MTRGLGLAFAAVSLLVFAVPARAAPGDLDRSFGTGGKVVRDLGPGDYPAIDLATGNFLGDMAIQDDGRIVTVGEVEPPRGPNGVIVARFRPSGRLDRSFAQDGTRILRMVRDTYAAGVAIQRNGKLVVGFNQLAHDDFGVARLQPDGRLDRRFDRDGIQTTCCGYTTQVAVGPDGKIVLAGAAEGGLAIARYTHHGQLDRSFSGDGLQTTEVDGRTGYAAAVSVDAEGRIVLAGSTHTEQGKRERFAIARFTPDGGLDPRFSDDGVLSSSIAEIGEDVAVLPGGRIVGVASAEELAVVIRFTEDGTPDPTFSGDGVRTSDFPAGGGSRVVALALAGRRVLVAGTTVTLRGGKDFAIARYRKDGRLDRAFSGDGRVATNVRGSDRALGVAVDPAGRTVVSGVTRGFNRGPNTALVRYLGGR
jgi:uncharacterized delta-60 repeat protein